jgi:hypothetical protein
MANLGILGFLKGASNVALDRLEARDKAEQEIKKEKMLMELRLSTNKELEDYKDLLESKNVDKDLSSTDLTSGKRILRNSKGTIIGEQGLTDTEKTMTQGSLDKLALDQEATRANIDQSKASAEASRASAGYSRVAAANYGKSKSGSLDSVNDDSVGALVNELIKQTSDLKAQYVGDGMDGNSLTPSEYRDLATEVVVRSAKRRVDPRVAFAKALEAYTKNKGP